MVTVKELWESGKFLHIKTLKYRDIISFVMENIKRNTFPAYAYFGYNLLNLVVLSVFVIYSTSSETYVFLDFVKFIIAGALIGSILVIPVHELIHGISYKLIGAPKIHFGADFRQMIFYVASDKFVLGRRAFYIVALSPFILINLITFLLMLSFSAQLTAGSLSFLLFHNTMCIGDFAMVSFFAGNKNKDLYTYDDHKEKTSYIFEKITHNP